MTTISTLKVVKVMKMVTVIKWAILLFSSLLAVNVLAHSGHGEAGEIVHAGEHLLWQLLSLLALVSIVYFIMKSRKHEKSDVKRRR